MVEWKVFECDVCGKELKFDANGKNRPHILKMFENGEEQEFTKLDLCEDCWFLILDATGEHYKEHDELANKLAIPLDA